MIAYVKDATLSNIRKAKQSLIARNVQPVILPKFDESGLFLDDPAEFVGFLGYIGHEDARRLADSCDFNIKEMKDWKSTSNIKLMGQIRLKIVLWLSGAIIFGRNPNPAETLEFK